MGHRDAAICAVQHLRTGANAKYKDGVAVFIMDEAGLMYEAAVGGQKFSYQPN